MEIIIGTTTSTKKEAQAIAAACVHKRIAACAHIDEIDSIYAWEGEVHSKVEYRVSLKTIESAYPAVATVIEELHTYDEPAIFCTEITGGKRSYLQWIQDHSNGEG